MGMGAGVGSGCSSQDVIDARPAALLRAHGRARVEITYEGLEPTLRSAIRFIRYRDLDSRTADSLVGSPPMQLAAGRCEVVSTESSVERALGPVPRRELVDHLDGGDVVISVGEMIGTVSPRDVPALHPYVTGLEYGEFAQPVASDLTPGQEVILVGYGGDAVGPFEVSARVPSLPTAVAADRGTDLGVTWDPGAGVPGELISVVVQRGFGEPALRCRTKDSGRLVVYRSMLSQLPGYRESDDLVVAVERTGRVPFGALGLDWGELEVSVRYVVIASAP